MSATNLQVSRLTATGWVKTGRGTATGGGGTGAALYGPTLTYNQVGSAATGIPLTAQTFASHSASWAAVSGTSSAPVFQAAANTTYSNMDIFGRVSASGPNVKLVNCRVRGYLVSPWVSESTLGLLHLTNSAISNFQATDCTLIPDNPSPDWDCVLGHDFTLTRCLLAHGSDLVGIQNSANTTGPSGVVIDTCYLNWFTFWTPEPAGTTPNSDAKTHNDVIQVVHGLKGIIIKNSSLNGHFSMPDGMGVLNDPFGYAGVGGDDPATLANASDGTAPNNPYYPSPTGNAALQVNSGASACSITADGNFFDGGAACINLPAATLAGFTLTNNQFGHNQRQGGSGSGFSVNYLGRVRPSTDPYYNDTATVISTAGKGYTISSNSYADNGVPIHVR